MSNTPPSISRADFAESPGCGSSTFRAADLSRGEFTGQIMAMALAIADIIARSIRLVREIAVSSGRAIPN